MLQLLFHLIGDYLTQSDWMAKNKSKANLPAIAHALIYSFPFMYLADYAPRPLLAWLVLLMTHYLIDRYRLARFVVFAKNFLSPKPWPVWEECSTTGYPSDTPVWLAVWLLIIADNTIHLTINYVALRWL